MMNKDFENKIKESFDDWIDYFELHFQHNLNDKEKNIAKNAFITGVNFALTYKDEHGSIA